MHLNTRKKQTMQSRTRNTWYVSFFTVASCNELQFGLDPVHGFNPKEAKYIFGLSLNFHAMVTKLRKSND